MKAKGDEGDENETGFVVLVPLPRQHLQSSTNPMRIYTVSGGLHEVQGPKEVEEDMKKT